MSKRHRGYDVIVIGGGIAGLTAVRQAAEYGLSAALLEPSALFGGQVATVTAIEGYPGIGMTSGADLAASLLSAARRDDVLFIEEAAQAVAARNDRLEVTTASQALLCRTVVLATGARLRALNVPRVDEFAGHGISHCASCDGPFFRDQDVAVVGGGDSALQEAALLAPICRSVTVVVRDRLRARQKYIARLKSFGNVRFLWDSAVEAVLGESTVCGVRLRNQDDDSLTELPCTGLFPFIGTIPNTEFLPQALQRDGSGRLLTDATFVTSQSGIYAIGAVRQAYSGELCSAAAEGAAVIKGIAATLA
jgi:thioredoxin reductase (NADPH)